MMRSTEKWLKLTVFDFDGKFLLCQKLREQRISGSKSNFFELLAKSVHLGLSYM